MTRTRGMGERGEQQVLVFEFVANQLLQRWNAIILQGMDLAGTQAARTVVERVDGLVRDDAAAVAARFGEDLGNGGLVLDDEYSLR